MSAKQPFVVDDEDDDPASYIEDEIEVQHYDESHEDSDDDAPIDDDEDFSITEYVPPAFVPPPAEFEIPDLALGCGLIKPGNIVELEDDSGRNVDHLISGDFLLVRFIIENMKDGQVVLRGYRMRRCAYLKPTFPAKFNDLFMILEVNDNDRRPRFVQALEDVAVDKVKRQRKCVFTNLNHALLKSSDVNTHAPAYLRTQKEIRDWIFNHGALICRWIYVVELHLNGKSYGGETGLLYKREVDAFVANSPIRSSDVSGPAARLPSPDVIPLDGESETYATNRREDKHPQVELRRSHPQKPKVYTIGDAFCGVGGTSEGARQAGFRVLFGLEKDSLAMQAYKKNFPEAMHLEMCAHDFPNMARRNTHGVDHCHMSCPCQFWSASHTREGKDDEANMLTIYTVGPFLQKLKPATFSLEQAFGLLTHEEHKMYFRTLLESITDAGYRVRWRIQDQAWFGLAQHRRRLIFIGAKIGTLLPPFPAPVYGPPGSGLKRFVTIEDSLRIIERQSLTFRDDPYHQPHREKQLHKPRIDPHVNLAKCITTSGGDNAHYSGTRRYTVRELAELQGFPARHHFTGTDANARKQAGNAWPPTASKHYFAGWGAFHEAFDHGYIDAEDEVLDLYEFLENKGIAIPRPATIDVDRFDVGDVVEEPKFRYLHRIEKTVHPKFPLPLWGKSKEIDRKPRVKVEKRVIRPQRQRNRDAETIDLLDGLFDGVNDEGDDDVRQDRRSRPRRPARIIQDASQEIIEISSESEDEMDEDSD